MAKPGSSLATGTQGLPFLKSAPYFVYSLGFGCWLLSLFTLWPLGGSGDPGLLQTNGALHFLLRCVKGTASPVLTQSEFPGKYQMCPYWGSKNKDRTVFVDPAYAHWDSLFKDDDRFRNLTAGKSCAIVGSSGILRSGAFGDEISAHDTVVRFGLADIANTSVAGNRTDILWLNPSTADKVSAGSLATQRTRLVIVAALVSGHYPCIRALAGRVASAGLDVAVGPVHCGFFRDAHAAAAGVSGRVPTSGMLTVAWALRFCASVDMYGVWPFATDCGGKEKVPYHYFDDFAPKKGATTHDFEGELSGYRALQRHAARQGVAFRLRLPANAQCESV